MGTVCCLSMRSASLYLAGFVWAALLALKRYLQPWLCDRSSVGRLWDRTCPPTLLAWNINAVTIWFHCPLYLTWHRPVISSLQNWFSFLFFLTWRHDMILIHNGPLIPIFTFYISLSTHVLRFCHLGPKNSSETKIMHMSEIENGVEFHAKCQYRRLRAQDKIRLNADGSLRCYLILISFKSLNRTTEDYSVLRPTS